MRHAEREASGGTHTAIVGVGNKLANASFAFQTYASESQILSRSNADGVAGVTLNYSICNPSDGHNQQNS